MKSILLFLLIAFIASILVIMGGIAYEVIKTHRNRHTVPAPTTSVEEGEHQ